MKNLSSFAEDDTTVGSEALGSVYELLHSDVLQVWNAMQALLQDDF